MKIFAYVLLWSSVLIGMIGCSASEKSPSTLETGWYYIVDIEKQNADGAVPMKLFKSKEDKIYHLKSEPIITASNIKTANIYEGFVNSKGIKMTLDSDGVKKWETATEKQIRKYVGFVLNNELIDVQRVAAKDLYGNTSIGRKDFDDTVLQKVLEDIQAFLPKDATAPLEKK